MATQEERSGRPERIRRAVAILIWLACTCVLLVLLGSAMDGQRDEYDPLAHAIASIGKTSNSEAGVPPMCYTKTDGDSNPCWVCHTDSVYPNGMKDAELQREYSFSEFALRNRWANLFEDRNDEIAKISDDAALKWIRTDNYAPLVEALKARDDYPGYQPDLDFAAGFDENGFALDGSGWRAVRYKPFPGTFWPTNGNTDDVFIRLPEEFRQDGDGNMSRSAYARNLEILELAIATPPGSSLELPSHFEGGAADVAVARYRYPEGTEFLHTVRYVDPDAPNLLSLRMKEVRYSRKVKWLDDWAIQRAYENEHNDKEEGVLPFYRGSPLTGYRNAFGWQLQGFIEDARGRLRLQTEEEHYFCMGCHSTIGVTVDQTFAFARKLPGAEGWKPQDLRGMHDAPQAGHDAPEYLTYMQRVKGGDEFRTNDEMLQRFFRDGQLQEPEVRKAANGGEQDLAWLLTPSRERALALSKAYLLLVRKQQFELGRDALLAPPKNVHAKIANGETELAAAERTFTDGCLWLEWE